MYYTVYKITNLVNSKIYVGVHKTANLNDSYMGSGQLIARAVAKYGLQNFKKEYLAVFDNPDDAFKMESELVNEEFVKSDNTYNLKEGGRGGWDHISNESRRKSAALGGKAIRDKFSNDRDFLNATVAKTIKTKRKKSPEETLHTIQKILSTKEKNGDYGFSGRTHTESTRKKMSQTRIERGLNKPERHSQFGSMWITDGQSNRKIMKSAAIPTGWHKGRTI